MPRSEQWARYEASTRAKFAGLLVAPTVQPSEQAAAPEDPREHVLFCAPESHQAAHKKFK